MNKKKDKRITIYDIAHQIGLAPSTVSNALNNKPVVSDKIKALVHSKVQELNYIHNSNAANLRRGSSRSIGVIVPKINTTFFADAIAGMEESCTENKYSLIICQSDESYTKEIEAVETLIRQNVECIIISLSMETRELRHLQKITDQHLSLIQFDRVNADIPSHAIQNDNKEAAYKAVRHLIDKGYKKIALLGGPDHPALFKERKEGYLKAIGEAELDIPYSYVCDDSLTEERGFKRSLELLKIKNTPDSFFAISDYAALGALRAASSMGLSVPEDIGIIGFSNEVFGNLIVPALSTVDQKSRKLGKDAVNIYFDHILGKKKAAGFKKEIIECAVIERESSLKKNARVNNGFSHEDV